LQAKLANATAGSYNALSAQYALNKIRINAMSQAERDAAEKSEQLISKTNALMDAMKRMQAETGQHQLNVGNYKSALDGLGKAMQGLMGNAGQLASGLGVGGLGGSFRLWRLVLVPLVWRLQQSADLQPQWLAV
jgi:hypothetical protein